MKCEPTKLTAMNARPGKSCAGAPSAAESGCKSGLPASPSGEAQVLRMFSAQPPQSNGSEAAEAIRATGAELHAAVDRMAERTAPHSTPTWLPAVAFALVCCIVLAMCGVTP